MSPLFVTRHARPWLTLQNSLPAVRGSACVCLCGEANGPNSNTAPLPGGRRVHLGSACWGGRRCAMSCRHSPRGVGGRASGGSSFVCVPGRCGTVYTAPRAVFPILHCDSSSGQPRGARTACVLLLAAGAEWAFLNSQPSILYKDTLGGDTRRMRHVRHVRVELAGRASSPERLRSAESRR